MGEESGDIGMTLVESMSARLHRADCFHILRRGVKAIYKVVFPEATEQQVREYIQAKKLAGRCCGSCLAWAVIP